MRHERQVKNILDWISGIGGVFQVFFFIMVLLIGGYSKFMQNMSMISALRKTGVKRVQKRSREKKHGDADSLQEKRPPPKRSKWMLYLGSSFLLRGICCCFRTTKVKKELKRIKVANKKLEKVLDLESILKSISKLRYFQEIVLKKLSINPHKLD